MPNSYFSSAPACVSTSCITDMATIYSTTTKMPQVGAETVPTLAIPIDTPYDLDMPLAPITPQVFGRSGRCVSSVGRLMGHSRGDALGHRYIRDYSKLQERFPS